MRSQSQVIHFPVYRNRSQRYQHDALTSQRSRINDYTVSEPLSNNGVRLSKDGNSHCPWLSIILDVSRYVILTADPSKFHSHYPNDANPFDCPIPLEINVICVVAWRGTLIYLPRTLETSRVERIETLITSNFPIRSRHMCAKLIRASFPPSNGRSRSLPSCLLVANEREKASSPTPIALFTLTIRRSRPIYGYRPRSVNLSALSLDDEAGEPESSGERDAFDGWTTEPSCVDRFD